MDINGFTPEEVGLALRQAVEGTHLKIGEVARHVEQATFGSEDVHSPDERPDVFPPPVSIQGPEEARLIAVFKSGDKPRVAQHQVLRRVEQGVDRFLAGGCRGPCTDLGRFIDLNIPKYDAGPRSGAYRSPGSR